MKNEAVTLAPSISCGSPAPVRFADDGVIAVAPENTPLCVVTSMKFGGESVIDSRPLRPWNSCTRRAGSRYGSGRSSTPLTTVKTAVLAPMPSASVRTATTAKPGWRRSMRAA